MALPHAQGVYAITNRSNGRVYVGSSLDIARRAVLHRCLLNAGTHYNLHLQRAWSKYGAQSFEFSVVEFVPDDDSLSRREQFHIDRLQSVHSACGYNAVPFASAGRQKKSEAHRSAMSAAAKRRWATMSAETRDELIAKQKARVMSPEQRKRLSSTQRTNPKVLDHLRALNAKQIGRPVSEEHRLKLSAALRGRPHTEAHKAAIASAKAAKRMVAA